MEIIFKQFEKVCPLLKWDRYTESDDEINAFGWIWRADGKLDFLVINFTIGEPVNNVWFCTSSAKYSADFSDLVQQKHSPCKKIN